MTFKELIYTPPSSPIDKSLLDQSFKNDKLYSTDLNTCSILYTKKKKRLCVKTYGKIITMCQIWRSVIKMSQQSNLHSVYHADFFGWLSS